MTDFAKTAQALAKKHSKKKPKLTDLREEFLSLHPHVLYSKNTNTLYLYDPTSHIYSPVLREEFEALIDEFLTSHHSTTTDVSSNQISDLYKSILRSAYLNAPNTVQLYDPSTPSSLTAFTDLTYDFKTHTTHPHSPNLHVFHKLDFPFPHSPSPTPYFNKFMDETFTDEDGTPSPPFADFMKDTLAYYISPVHAPNPTAVILSGSGSNGKSIYLDLLSTFIDPTSVSSLSLEDLSDRYGGAELINKRLNIVSEDESKYIKPDKLKAIITMEKIKAERKYEHPFFFKPEAKHIISTNKDLRFEDMDFATLRRLHVAPFNRTFVPVPTPPNYPQVDNTLTLPITPNLKQHLTDELPGILYDLIQRAKKLAKNNFQLTPPEPLLQASKDLQSNANSALEFLNEHYTYDPDHKDLIATTYLYAQYKRWYEDDERPQRYMLQKNQFYKAIRKNFPATTSREKVHDPHTNKTSAAKAHLRPIKTITPYPEPISNYPL